jgi:hypothetical protein
MRRGADHVFAPYNVKTKLLRCAELLFVSALWQDASSVPHRKVPSTETDDIGKIMLTENAHQVSNFA